MLLQASFLVILVVSVAVRGEPYQTLVLTGLKIPLWFKCELIYAKSNYVHTAVLGENAV